MQIFSDNPKKVFGRLRRNITHTTIKHVQTRCDIALASPSPTHLPFEPFDFKVKRGIYNLLRHVVYATLDFDRRHCIFISQQALVASASQTGL